MNIQPFSVNDGEGIRTNIFMAGCPLRCKWCSNPEGFERRPLVGWYQKRCIGCGACASACPEGIGINMNAPLNEAANSSEHWEGCSSGILRSFCTACGACVKACPEEARVFMVKEMDTDDIIREVQKHRLFYSYSGGGVTFSGGEATSQPEFLDALSRELYDMGYSLDIESCGYFDFEMLRPSLERMDLIFMDLKHMDPEVHKQYTGVSNERILENIRKLGSLKRQEFREAGTGRKDGTVCVPESGAHCGTGDTDRGSYCGPDHGPDATDRSAYCGPDLVIRIPVIGGVNNSEENIAASAAYVHKVLPQARMELLPYHSFGRIKYEAIGMPFDQSEFYTPDKEEIKKLRGIAAAQGVELADYR